MCGFDVLTNCRVLYARAKRKCDGWEGVKDLPRHLGGFAPAHPFPPLH
jgi:hypothetical protein